MSLYRRAVQHGALVRQKRKFIRRWLWYFNLSEEDHLNRMRNKLLVAKAEVTMYQRRIPQEEDRIKQIKDGLQIIGGTGVGPSYHDSFSFRTEPVRLFEKVTIGRKRADRPTGGKKPVVLAKLTTA